MTCRCIGREHRPTTKAAECKVNTAAGHRTLHQSSMHSQRKTAASQCTWPSACRGNCRCPLMHEYICSSCACCTCHCTGHCRHARQRHSAIQRCRQLPCSQSQLVLRYSCACKPEDSCIRCASLLEAAVTGRSLDSTLHLMCAGLNVLERFI